MDAFNSGQKVTFSKELNSLFCCVALEPARSQTEKSQQPHVQ